MVHWKTFLALCAILVPIQAGSLGYLIVNERRLTRIETIIEIRLPRAQGEAAPTASAHGGSPQVEARNRPSR